MWGGGTNWRAFIECFATGMYLWVLGWIGLVSCVCIVWLLENWQNWKVNAAGILWQRKWCVKDVLFVISLSWPTALLLSSHNMSLFLAFHQTIFCRSPSKVTLLLKIRAAATDCPEWRTVVSTVFVTNATGHPVQRLYFSNLKLVVITIYHTNNNIWWENYRIPSSKATFLSMLNMNIFQRKRNKQDVLFIIFNYQYMSTF